MGLFPRSTLMSTSDRRCRHAALSDKISSKMVICTSNQTDFNATPVRLHDIYLCLWVAVYNSDLQLSYASQREQSINSNTKLLWKFRHISGRMWHVCMACLTIVRQECPQEVQVNTPTIDTCLL